MKKALLAVAAAIAISAGAAGSPVNAAPVSPAVTVPGKATPDVTQVQYRRFYGPRPVYRPYYARGYGYRPFVGFGIGAGIVAGAIIANSYYAPRRGYYYDTYDYTGPYYYPSDYRGDPRVICARHFKSFEWRTGLYTTYQGEKRMCPYLGV